MNQFFAPSPRKIIGTRHWYITVTITSKMFYFVRKINEQSSNVNESWKGNKDYFTTTTTTTTKYSFRVHDAKM